MSTKKEILQEYLLPTEATQAGMRKDKLLKLVDAGKIRTIHREIKTYYHRKDVFDCL